jgi:hypothetical protein
MAGGGAVICSAAQIAATVVTNPPAPGTATLSVTDFSFSGCTSSIQGTTGVESVTFDNLPYRMSISDATSPATATWRSGDAGPVQLTLVLHTPSGPVHCIYRPHASSMTTALTSDGIAFDAPFDVALSPEVITEPCGHVSHYSGAFGPFHVGDAFQQWVYVN